MADYGATSHVGLMLTGAVFLGGYQGADRHAAILEVVQI